MLLLLLLLSCSYAIFILKFSLRQGRRDEARKSANVGDNQGGVEAEVEMSLACAIRRQLFNLQCA